MPDSQWNSTTIAESIVPLTNMSRSKIQTREYKANGKFPVIDQGQDYIAGYTDDESTVIADNLPLVVFGDHTRAFKYVDFPFARGADGTQLLRPKSNLDPLFFYYACRAIDLPARGYNRHFTVLKEKEFSFPTKLEEQREIALVLSGAESALKKQSAIIENLRELKVSTMRDLFSLGLKREQQKESEIGLIPQSWSLKNVVDLCDILSGGTPRKSETEYWNGDIPWVSGKDLKTHTLDDAIDHITSEAVQAGSRIVPAGTVLLLVRGMGLAKDLPVAVISRPMAFNQDLKALVPTAEYSGQYIRSAIYSGKVRLLSQIVPSAHGTMTLNLNDVENFKIPCPTDIDEADEIVSILGSIDNKAKLHIKKRILLEDLFKALLNNLMSRQISVNELNFANQQLTTLIEKEIRA